MGGAVLDGSVVSHWMSNNYELVEGGELPTLSDPTSLHYMGIISSNTNNSQIHDQYTHIQQLEEEVQSAGGGQAFVDAADYYQRLPSLFEHSGATFDNPLSGITTIRCEVGPHKPHDGCIPCNSFMNAETTLPLSFPSASTYLQPIPIEQQAGIIVSGSISSPFVSDASVGNHTLHDDESNLATENQSMPSAQHYCSQALMSTSCEEDFNSHIATSPPLSGALSLTSIISTNASTPAKMLPAGLSMAVENEGSCHDNLDIKCRGMRHSFKSSKNGMDIGILSNTGLFKKRHPSIIADKVNKKKRKRTRPRKNVEELESQRMTHIAVERNRRRQMNQHLHALRSLMPSSYIQRGDQASIVGGAIRFVEELEQVVQSLRLQTQMREQALSFSHLAGPKRSHSRAASYACSQSPNVIVEVNVASLSSILVKVLVSKRPHQLLHTLHAFNLLSLKVVHLTITSLDITILYSFNLELEKHSKVQNPAELAKSIRHTFEISKDNLSQCVVL